MSNPTLTLPRSAPEAQGISSDAILTFLHAAEKELDALHSFMLVRHGAVVAEGWWTPYAAENKHVLFSLSKSFCSTAAGFAIAEGLLSVEDKVVSFFPDDLPAEVSENLAAMRVHDLLAMATGNAEDTTGYLHRDPDGNWVKAFLARPVEHTPGTHFVYNSGATYMVSAIVTKIAGMSLIDYLTPRLFVPLGIEGATWDSCPRGINVGGWGLKVKTDDIAKFGQLYLQNGIWDGKQVLPEGWVATATAKQISNGDNPDNDWNQGYGYQFWRCRYGAYRGDGAFGQYCVVLPEQDAVIAITSGIGPMGLILQLVWDELLPAMRDEPLPENMVREHALKAKLAALTLPGPIGQATSATGESVSGNVYTLPENEKGLTSVGFVFGEEGAMVTIVDGKGTHTVRCGSDGDWINQTTALDANPGEPLAASGAWTGDATYEAFLYYSETPFRLHLKATFSGTQVMFERKVNVGFGPTEPIVLTGHLQA